MKWQEERVARGADYKRHVREGESGDNDAAEVRCLSKECRKKNSFRFCEEGRNVCGKHSYEDEGETQKQSDK